MTMTQRVLLHETRTGAFVKELTWSKASYVTGVCVEDKVTVELPAYAKGNGNLQGLLVPLKYTLTLVDEDGRVPAAGILGIPGFGADRDGLHRAIARGTGAGSNYEERYVLPYPYGSLVDANRRPVAAHNTTMVGLEYGTIMKRLYQQAMAHPGGELPAVFEPDRAGTRERSWLAVDGEGVQDSIEKLSELQNGVEWDWVPAITDKDRLVWSLVTGRDSVREISSAYIRVWQIGGPKPALGDWEGETSPETLASSVIFTGGKEEDSVMVAQRYNGDLIDGGLPLREVWDSSHATVSKQSRLNSLAEGRLADGQAPLQYWSFKVRRERAVSLRHGDYVQIDAEGHWAIPDGSYRRRVVEIRGKFDASEISVTVMGEMQW